MRHPVAVLIPTLGVPAPARLAVPARPVQRAGRLDPAAARPVARGLRPAAARSSARASSRRSCWPSGPTGRRPTRTTWPRCYDYSRRLAADPRVTRVDSLVDVDPRLTLDQYQLLYGDPNGPRDRFVGDALAATTRGDLTAFTVYTPYGPNRDEGKALVADLRDPAGAARAAGRDRPCWSAAARPTSTDVVDRVAADFPRTALFIIVTTYLVLFVLLRSVVLPAKALIMNTLSIVASFGALVWIFQDGNLSGVLGFQPLGFVETTQPVILFCVLFGLSMDYEVFLLSRMKEVWDRTGDNTEAVARGLERSGRIVTSAALIVVVVAGSFAFADIVLIKALGIGMAIAIALDATVVRALLVPATMRLLGRWNWWMPAWLGADRRGPPAGGRGRRGSGDAAMTGRLGPRWARLAPWLASLVLLPILAGCTGGAPILAAPVAPRPSLATPTPPPVAVADPLPVVLPRDDGPHDRLTEWWYYTGHLRADDGASLRLRVRHLPRRARRLPDVVGLAPGHHRRERRPVRLRPATRGRQPGGPVAASVRTANRSASTWP